MKVLFVQAYRERVGVEYLSAYLKQHGHQVELFFDPVLFNNTSFVAKRLSNNFNMDGVLAQHVKLFKPDVVAFSVLTLEYQWALGKAELVKKISPQASIIFGGIHPTSCPDVVIQSPFVDAVCVGDGELPLRMFLEQYLGPSHDVKIPNLWIKESSAIIKNDVTYLTDDLDKLPFPDKSIFYDAVPIFKRNYSIMMGRGCPFHCSFCCNNVLHKIYKSRYLRMRKIDNCLAELVRAKEVFKPRRIEFLPTCYFFSVKKSTMPEFFAKSRS